MISRLAELHTDGRVLGDLKRILYSRISKKGILSRRKFEENILAFGEEASAKLLASKFGLEYVDPRNLFLFNESGSFLEEESIKMIRKTLTEINKQVIIPGFYGYNQSGDIVTFPRGGSDISGAYIGVAMGVDVYENFTDSPIAATDPRIVNEPKFISEMTYRELRNLTYFGFDILHKDVIKPLMDFNVPIHVRSTENFPNRGTWVSLERECSEDDCQFVGMAYKGNFHLLTFYKYGLNEEVGGLADLFGILANHGLSIEHDNTGIDTCSVLIRDEVVEDGFGSLEKLIGSLKSRLGDYEIGMESNIDCLVFSGIGLNHGSNKLRLELGTLFSEAGIGYGEVSQNDVEYSLIYKIFSGKGKEALNLVYNNYFR